MVAWDISVHHDNGFAGHQDWFRFVSHLPSLLPAPALWMTATAFDQPTVCSWDVILHCPNVRIAIAGTNVKLFDVETVNVTQN